MYRSFAALRMTRLRIAVILSAAKDLYDMLPTLMSEGVEGQKFLLKKLKFPIDIRASGCYTIPSSKV